MGAYRRGPSEKSVFQDPATGWTIWRLTNSQREDKHTYYDICPWSSDQKYIVFSSADPSKVTVQRGDNLAAPNSQVYVIDTATYGFRQIADDAYFTTHNGAHPMWHPSKKRVYYYQAPGKVGVVDAVTGKLERTMEGGIRQLSPDGRLFAFQSNEEDYLQGRGVYTMGEDGSDPHRVVPTEELYRLTPNRDQFDLAEMTVGNTKWTPDSRNMLVAMWVHSRPKVRRSIYVVSRDGSESRWLCYFGGHHSWTPDGKEVLYCNWKRQTDDGVREDRRLFLIDFDGSNERMVIEASLGSHPAMNPAKTMIVDFDREGVVLVRIPEQKVERLAVFSPTFDMTHSGTHPHCIWSPDGSQIMYNSAQTGHSQIYVIPMTK